MKRAGNVVTGAEAYRSAPDAGQPARAGRPAGSGSRRLASATRSRRDRARQPQDLEADLGEEVRELADEREVLLPRLLGQLLPGHQVGVLAGCADRSVDEALRCALSQPAVVLHARQELDLVL